MESCSAFNGHDFTSNPENILSEPPVLIEKQNYFNNGTNTDVSFSINQEQFLAYPSIFGIPNCYSLENDVPEQPLVIYNLSKRKKEIVLKVAEHGFDPVSISTVCLFPKNSPNFLLTGDCLGHVKIFSLADKSFKLVNSFELFKGIPESDKFLQCMIAVEDKFREILKDTNEPPILLIASLGTDEPLQIYNLKGENIFKIPGIPDGICHKFDYYHEESQAKTFLFCGWSKVSVNKFDFSLQKYTICYQLKGKEIKVLEVVENDKLRYLVFADQNSNKVMIADTEKENIIRVIELVDDDGIEYTVMNLIVWNSKKLLVSTYNPCRPLPIFIINKETGEIQLIPCFEGTEWEWTKGMRKIKDENGKESLVLIKSDHNIYLLS